jgi:hypothetical protein
MLQNKRLDDNVESGVVVIGKELKHILVLSSALRGSS